MLNSYQLFQVRQARACSAGCSMFAALRRRQIVIASHSNHNIYGRADLDCTRLNSKTTPPARKRRALSFLLSLEIDVTPRYVNKRFEPCRQVHHSPELNGSAGLCLHISKMGELKIVIVSAPLDYLANTSALDSWSCQYTLKRSNQNSLNCC